MIDNEITSSNVEMRYDIEIVNFEFDEDKQTITVIKKRKLNMNVYPSFTEVYKEIYGVKDGKLQLLDTIKGKYFPSEFVEERIEFPQ